MQRLIAIILFIISFFFGGNIDKANVWPEKEISEGATSAEFVFENKTKVYFGKGGVKEYLGGLLANFGETVMLAYGGGSIKRNGGYDEIMGILNVKRLLRKKHNFLRSREGLPCATP